jgi:serine/threonine protein kinase
MSHSTVDYDMFKNIPEDVRSDLLNVLDFSDGRYILNNQYVYKEYCGAGANGIVVAVAPATGLEHKHLAAKIARKGGNSKFELEANEARNFYHPSFLPIMGQGLTTKSNVPFFLMPRLADGSTLQDLIRSRQLTVFEVLRLGLHLSHALGSLHDSLPLGKCHRDIKPGNIWIFSGIETPIILDLGTMRDPEHQRPETTIGHRPHGTAQFSPAEQILGRSSDIGAHSDLYALASTLYLSWTGSYPIPVDEKKSYEQHMNAATPPCHILDLLPGNQPQWVQDFGRCLMGLLEHDTKARCATAKDGTALFQKLLTIKERAVQHNKYSLGHDKSLNERIDQIDSTVTEIRSLLLATQNVENSTLSGEIKTNWGMVQCIKLSGPMTPNEYKHLFGGFNTGEFRAYGAPFNIERRLDASALTLHIDRIRLLDKCLYIFTSMKSFNQAAKFFHQVRESAIIDDSGYLSLNKKKLQLKKDSNPQRGAQLTYFIGSGSKDVGRCVLYFLHPDTSEPEMALICEGNLSLVRLLGQHFDEQWGRIDSVTLPLS